MIKHKHKNGLIAVLVLIGLFFIALSLTFSTPPKKVSALVRQDRYYTDYDTNAYSYSSSFSVNKSDGNINAQIIFNNTASTVEKFKSHGVINGYSSHQIQTLNSYYYFFNESDRIMFESAVTNYDNLSSISSFRKGQASYSGGNFRGYISTFDYDYIAIITSFVSLYRHESTFEYYDYYKCVYSKIVPLKKDDSLINKVDNAINDSVVDVDDTTASSRANVLKNLLPYSSYGYVESNKSGDVTVLYKGYDENGNIADKSFVFNVEDKNLLREKYYAKYLLSKTQFSQLSDFNVISKGLANAGDGYILNNKYTVLEALDISVDLSNFNNPIITIVYDNITANDIAFTVMSNDEEYSELKVDVYCGDISSNGETGTITFRYEDIETILASTVHWILDISSNTEDIQVVTDNETTVTITDTQLIVNYDLSKQNSLLNLNILYIGETQEARLYDVELNYTEFEISLGTVLETPRQVTFTAYDLGIKNAVAVPSNIITGVGTSVTDLYYFPSYGDMINGAISSQLKELNYCYYLDATLSAPSLYTTDKDEIEQKIQNGEAVGKYVINIEYGYHPIFFVQSSGLKVNYNFFLVSPFASTLTVDGTYFVEQSDIPYGYRVSSFTIPSNYLTSSTQDVENYAKSTFSFNQGFNYKVIIPITVNYSDTYIIKFDYFVRYNNTPFALLTSFNGEAKVSDFKDITKPTAKELSQVLHNNGVKNVVDELSFLGLVKPDESLITYKCTSPGVYEFVVPYTYASVKAQESNGSFSETKVPMTKYCDWTAQWGESWGVTMLNHQGAMYFNSNDTYLKENLYGLFGCIQFKEQMKNINDWFNDVSNGGCVVEYQRKEVRGSQVYTFVTENKTLLTAATALGGFLIGGISGGIIGALIPSVLQIGCEIVNDENATYYSHFFYLDGTSKLSYVSNSGASDYDDNDPAIENTFENNGFKDILNLIVAILLIIGAISLIVLLVNLISKINSKVWRIILYVVLGIGVGVGCYFAFPVVFNVVSAVF